MPRIRIVLRISPKEFLHSTQYLQANESAAPVRAPDLSPVGTLLK